MAYDLPKFLEGVVSRDKYVRWMKRIASAHVTRDRKRGNETATGKEYNQAIHGAVIESQGRDFYTGEPLDWTLVSKYDNEKSKAGGREYKKSFAMKPTVDHVGDGSGPANFKICSWRTNSAKSDLELDEFIELCQKVVKYNQPSEHKG